MCECLVVNPCDEAPTHLFVYFNKTQELDYEYLSSASSFVC